MGKREEGLKRQVFRGLLGRSKGTKCGERQKGKSVRKGVAGEISDVLWACGMFVDPEVRQGRWEGGKEGRGQLIINGLDLYHQVIMNTLVCWELWDLKGSI